MFDTFLPAFANTILIQSILLYQFVYYQKGSFYEQIPFGFSAYNFPLASKPFTLKPISKRVFDAGFIMINYFFLFTITQIFFEAISKSSSNLLFSTISLS
jgi:hypothetical protein